MRGSSRNERNLHEKNHPVASGVNSGPEGRKRSCHGFEAGNSADFQPISVATDFPRSLRKYIRSGWPTERIRNVAVCPSRRSSVGSSTQNVSSLVLRLALSRLIALQGRSPRRYREPGVVWAVPLELHPSKKAPSTQAHKTFSWSSNFRPRRPHFVRLRQCRIFVFTAIHNCEIKDWQYDKRECCGGHQAPMTTIASGF